MSFPLQPYVNKDRAYSTPTLNVKLLSLKLLDDHTGVVSAETKCIA